MRNFLILFFVIFFFQHSLASQKDELINKLYLIKNLSFRFEQLVGENKENGRCVISFPKKIFCEYQNKSKKILVSNGKSLVIKNRINNQKYFYNLKSTMLNLILDKDYLINSIKEAELRIIDEKYINFLIKKDGNELSIFFDKRDLNLTGWQTQDIYKNLVITFITDIKINKNINEKLFILPD